MERPSRELPEIKLAKFRAGIGRVSQSAHAGPKLLAAAETLLLAKPRWIQYLSRAEDAK
jgi:hypothetical protein